MGKTTARENQRRGPSDVGLELEEDNGSGPGAQCIEPRARYTVTPPHAATGEPFQRVGCELDLEELAKPVEHVEPEA